LYWQRSSLHSINESYDKPEMCDMVEVVEDECDAPQSPQTPQPPMQPPPQQQWKRQRTGDAIGATASSSSGDASAMVADLAAQVARQAIALQSHSSGSSSDSILVRKALLTNVQDAIDRAAVAAKHAITISNAAAKAFSDEHERLIDCSRELSKQFSKI
jgi:hypothetical protein